MKCNVSFDKLLIYSRGECDAEEAAALRRHVSRCTECKRELEAISCLEAGLATLPEITPEERCWEEVKGSIARRRAGSVALAFWMLNYARSARVAAALMLLAAVIGTIQLVRRRSPVAPGTDIAVEEMGSRIAHRNLSDEDLNEALEGYFRDAEKIVEEALRCAAEDDAGRWRAFKEELSSRDMIYRALYLRRNVAGTSTDRQGVAARSGRGELLDDSLRFFRAIDRYSPETLAREGSRVEREVAKLNLINRLKKGTDR